jgi:hypothetical protein
MLEEVSVVAELEHFGIAFEHAGQDKIKLKCCFHDDHSPSAVIRTDNHSFRCYGCDARGDLVDFLAKYAGQTRQEVLLLLAQRYNLTKTLRPIHASRVEEPHAAIWQEEGLLKELYKRCVDDDLIRKYRLGAEKGRITIPVMDPNGKAFINIRSYLPGAPGHQKMRNLRGRKKLAIYPHDQLLYDTLVFTGGEIKALAASKVLNPHEIGAVAITGGEGEWDTDLNPLLTNKHLIVIMDIDDKGQRAAKKIARAFMPFAASVKVVDLPLDPAVHPNGDINDFLADEGCLHTLIENAKEFDPRIKLVDWSSGEYIDRSISDAIRAEYIGQRSHVDCLVTGIAEQRFSVPKQVQVCCDRGSKFCGQCPVAIMDRDVYSIPAESPNVLAMLDASEEAISKYLDKELSVPSKCVQHHYAVLERTGAEIAVVSPALGLKATSSDQRESQKAIILGDGAEANEEYALDCRAQPDPKSQETVLLASRTTKKTSALSEYVFDHEDLCKVFQPSDWSIESLTIHLADLYDALASVTGIRQRPELHMGIDLAYHSPLYIEPEGKLERGWIETLILGDSSQGKTQAAVNLQTHYRLGHKVDSKNASVAGLIGGLQKLGGMWMVTWGALPTHDQRLVILEELKGASVEVISALTDVRSSGVATIEKIRSGRRNARTRLVALSNPRSIRPLNSYGHGVEAILELVGSPEDVRRFDLCMCLGKEDLSYDVIHTLEELHRNHPFSSDACHHNIMWAWTRTSKQVVFRREVWGAILDASKRFCGSFTEQIPIVDAGSMRLKIARLAASLAARTFSTEDCEHVLVRDVHVEYIERFLQRVYTSKSMRYDSYSDRQSRLLKVEKPDELIEKIKQVPYAEALLDFFQGASVVSIEEIQNHGGIPRADAEEIMGYFIRSYAIVQRGRAYVTTSGFRSLLDKLKGVKFHDRF